MASSSSIISDWLHQEPRPGAHQLRFRGDVQTFRLYTDKDIQGKAWIRTNIGQARIIRQEIIDEITHETPKLGRAWLDIPMRKKNNRHFEITLALCEVGHFEAKCFFLPEGETMPLWPEGGNTIMNVAPADNCCSNIIYNAFVRQFGPNKTRRKTLLPDKAEIVRIFDEAGYTVIPPSGTFRDLIHELDFIIYELGCRFLQLLPIHPTPTTFARMGRFGSPYASLSFTAVDPALAEFDPKATPLEQFIELVDAVHARNAKVLLDIAINHTGWAASLHETHPEWLVRDEDGRIEAPGAWGVIWADLTKLDFSKTDLWEYMAEVFLTWCHRGVDGFRCDAGYMIPVPAWIYIVAAVRKQYPDTIFLLEGLGGKISVTRVILSAANFNWAYSELFQNYDRGQVSHYLPEAFDIARENGVMIHFAETHDNNRLAAKSHCYARMRTALCALCAPYGAYGFAGGVEWYATEKIDVHEATSLNWGAAENQIEHIRRLSEILRLHPCFHDQTDLRLLELDGGNQVALLRHHRPSAKRLLILANLDDQYPAQVNWNMADCDLGGTSLVDLIEEKEIFLSISQNRAFCSLAAGQVLCLTSDRQDLDCLHSAGPAARLLPKRIRRQQLRAKALDIHIFYHGLGDISHIDPDIAAEQFADNPIEYCRRQNPFSEETRIIEWRWPEDCRREVMVPPGHFLFIQADRPFRARILQGQQVLSLENSFARGQEGHFCLFQPLDLPARHSRRSLKISLFNADHADHVEAPLLYLSSIENCKVITAFNRHDLLHRPLCFNTANGRGGAMRARVAWGRLESRYDALLAANINPIGPTDRTIMFARCRAWIVFQGFSQEICLEALDFFTMEAYTRGIWQFRLPSGQGGYTLISICLEMPAREDKICMTFYRHPSNGDTDRLADDKPVNLILRPDIECRNFHETTKAYLGPENVFPGAIRPGNDHFIFSPYVDRHLRVDLPGGSFYPDFEWYYMVYRGLDEERGLDPHSDLFSPGYFQISLTGGATAALTAEAGATAEQSKIAGRGKKIRKGIAFSNSTVLDPVEALTEALDQFLTTRGELKSVIAGYPWFLDWGRDSLIFTRGLIAAGKLADARDVLMQFGQFENNGTLPNMIRGQDAGNRETADAPLWFFIACEDLFKAEGNDFFLGAACGSRTIRDVLLSIGSGYLHGNPNGVSMDPETGLIFCPSHFTWMDTNFPAGTPRQGYPIEIQALWYRALCLLAQIDAGPQQNHWKERADQVLDAILRLYTMDHGEYFADCLQCAKGVSAANAEPDDALRPNQLLTITLGALTEKLRMQKMLRACATLLVPGAIRSLADRPLRKPLEIHWQGRLISDPYHPYRGIYTGDEDTSRKPAYHNGTSWTWLFPSFCEAWLIAYGSQARQTALNLLGSSMQVMNTGTIGLVPEILDGDFPHHQKGCDAQAWGVSELLRVWKLLEKK